ncbi:MAG: metallophosphoesterase [bacterium]|nr:metallophosphoesterase [bacterium]
MKIIAFGDIHEYLHPLDALSTELRQADLILVSGDITRWRGPETASKILHAIKQYNPNLLAQIGNTDSWETHHHLEQLGINLHGRGHRFGDIGIFGVGGSNSTPFYTPSEFSEEELATYLKIGYEMIQDAPCKILVAHCPPYQTAIDRLYSGYHVGSTSVRQFIETHQPDICISGHIHEAPGEDHIGKTLLLNPGMLAQGGYINVTYNAGTLSAHRVPGRDAQHYGTSPFLPSSW